MTDERKNLWLAVQVAEVNAAHKADELVAARAALAAHDAAAPPYGTIVSFDGGVFEGRTYAIRVAYHHGRQSDGPGWRTIFNDFSGAFYPDSDGGLSDFWLSDQKEVYRP